MPNWCEGTLRVRGASKNIARFIKEGLGVYKLDFETFETVPVDKSEWLNFTEKDGFMHFKTEYQDIYVEGTHRAFITILDEIGLNPDIEDEVICFDFKQAWGCNPEEWVNLAKKYDLDFAIYGIESGFNIICDIRVTEHGEKVEDNSIEYSEHNDFVFNCPFPWMGG